MEKYDAAVMRQAGEAGWKSGKIVRCPECNARRNMFHRQGCPLGPANEAERRAVVDAETIISDAHSAKEYIEDVAARKPYGEAKEA